MAVFSHPVVNLENKQVGTVDLMAEVFKLEEINNHLIWESVRHHLARRRAGTAKTKDKSEVSGSGRKLWKQKGTGRARVGSIRSIIWKGGGTAHGPNPRCFDYCSPSVPGAPRCATPCRSSSPPASSWSWKTGPSIPTRPRRSSRP